MRLLAIVPLLTIYVLQMDYLVVTREDYRWTTEMTTIKKGKKETLKLVPYKINETSKSLTPTDFLVNWTNAVIPKSKTRFLLSLPSSVQASTSTPKKPLIVKTNLLSNTAPFMI